MRESEVQSTNAKTRVLFGFPRKNVRDLLLPIISGETRTIQQLQLKYRTPFLDSYMQAVSFTGSHTFYMVFLPMLFWVGYSRFARQLSLLMAVSTYIATIIKDALCLPRPLSPPVVKLSSSHQTEYGFPSSHALTAVNLPFFAFYYYLDQLDAPASWPVYLVGFGLCAFHVLNIGVSRVYCGMHTVTDVVGGTVLGSILLYMWTTYYATIDRMLFEPTFAPLFVILLAVALVLIHPDPVDPTPSFDDSVSFLFVGVGISWATYMHSRSTYDAAEPFPATVIYDYAQVGPVTTVLRIVFGIALILAWRVVAKKVCYLVLPPIYRLFGLPARKFHLPAKMYDKVDAKITVSPSVLHLPNVGRTAANEAPRTGVTRGDASSKDAVAAEATFHRLPRYDVDVLTRCIGYAGIGWIASFGAPIMFRFLGMESALF